jgi:hypothetical protein
MMIDQTAGRIGKGAYKYLKFTSVKNHQWTRMSKLGSLKDHVNGGYVKMFLALKVFDDFSEIQLS